MILLDTQDLLIFKHVADLHSISRAAEKLDYVQSNVSQRIKILEDELSARLLIRSNRGVKLTEEGTTLYKYAEDILKLMQDAKSAIDKNKWREYLVIGATQTVSAALLPKLFLLFMKENDDIGMSMKTQDKQRLQEMLFYGEIDGMFVNGLFDEERFESVHSLTEDIVFLSHQNFKFEEDGCPTLIVNSDTTCMYRNKTFEVAKDKGYTDPRIMEFDTLESILNAVESGMGMSVVPKRILDNRKTMQGIIQSDLSMSVRIEFIVSLKKKRSKSLQKFIRFIKSLSLNV